MFIPAPDSLLLYSLASNRFCPGFQPQHSCLSRPKCILIITACKFLTAGLSVISIILVAFASLTTIPQTSLENIFCKQIEFLLIYLHIAV